MQVRLKPGQIIERISVRRRKRALQVYGQQGHLPENQPPIIHKLVFPEKVYRSRDFFNGCPAPVLVFLSLHLTL